MNEKNIEIREATLNDWALLLTWRNDPVTRKSSHNPEIVPDETHQNWLKAVLENPDRRLFIAYEGDEGVGTCRADHAEGVHELSWTVAPHARGRGMGKKMVLALAALIGGRLRAEVREGNPASGRIAEAAGMTFGEQNGNILHYRNY